MQTILTPTLSPEAIRAAWAHKPGAIVHKMSDDDLMRMARLVNRLAGC